MQRLCGLARLAGALLLLSFAGSAAAEQIQVPGGTPPENTTTWILVSKPGKIQRPGRKPKKVKGFPGTQIHANGTPDGRAVTPDINPTSGALGDVRDAHKGECECIHYHGRLFGKEDPLGGRGCGWGCVIRFDLAPDSVAFLSAAFMFEERALQKSLIENVDGAISDLELGMESLNDALQSEPSVGEGRWDPRDSKEYKNALGDALKLDQQALEKLKAARGEKNREKKLNLLEDAEDKLMKAARLKSKMMLKLAKELGLGEHDDED